jgi:hypothetical protein
VTVVVLTFVTELCGVWHVAHILPEVIHKFFVGYLKTASFKICQVAS